MGEEPLQPAQQAALSTLFTELDLALSTPLALSAARWRELDRHLGLLRSVLAGNCGPRSPVRLARIRDLTARRDSAALF